MQKAESSTDEDYPYSFYCDRRHLKTDIKQINVNSIDWRIKEKIKTVSVSLVLCLNIGVDPPDLIKTKPCAKMECWIDPFVLPGQRALEAIGRNLQSQYEAWQPRARYRLSLDPSIEETKKLCCSLRRNAKDERILFHYNGHGVPRPTAGGEIWVFNKSYTQYIPVSVYDIQTWLGSPCVYVYDCSNAGHILNSFNKFAEKRDEEMRSQQIANVGMEGVHVPYTPLSQCIQLAACRSDEVLPMSPDLPADLFTSCLTTPITMALRWFVISNPLIKNVTLEMTMKVPGRVTDRRTPLGELNWIFTSITDTIAWSVLPTDLFLRLFRNDLMVAALFRNYLLADRIMRNFNCHPVSDPVLPQTHQHPMWEAWDLAADHCLSQLPSLLDKETNVEYKLSSFFSDQLSAFEVWIKKGGSTTEPPLQLPIVLQVLLSQVHRLRALLLLSKFLDFGEWAVNLALSVGIFPYVLKLLQSPALELRPVLVFIWAKLLAVDPTCRNDLLKDNGYTYFIGILTNTNTSAFLVPNISEHRAMCVFILSVFCRDFPAGQHACLSNDLLPALLPYLIDQDSLLRQWTTVCLANFWANFADAKWAAIQANAHEQLSACLLDPVPEVRAGALAALGYLLGDLDRVEQVLNIEKSIIVAILKCLPDPSPLVRKELACALSRLIQVEESKFLFIAFEVLEENRRPNGADLKKFSPDSPYNDNRKGPIQQSLHLTSWKALLTLSADPFHAVAAAAGLVVDRIYQKLMISHFADPSLLQWIETTKSHLANVPLRSSPENIIAGRKVSKKSNASVSSGIFGMSLESPSQTLKRASSFQFSLKSLIGGSNSSIGQQSDTPPRNARVSSSIRRRPQSLIVSGSAGDFSSPIRPSASHQEIQKASPPSKPLNVESTVLVPSTFYDWSCEYFTEPQMKIPEIDDPGSLKYAERQWRSQRNHKLNLRAVNSYADIGSTRFETLAANIPLDMDIDTKKITTLFHSYDSFVVAADATDISVIDTNSQQSLHLIRNCNAPGSNISVLKFLNEEDTSILLAGSTDGIVRLYKDYSDSKSARLLTAWRVSTDTLPSQQSLICEWHQNSGMLYTCGYGGMIRVWDADEEMCIQEITTDPGVGKLSIEAAGNLLLAGLSDGIAALFDRRLSPEKGAVARFGKSDKSNILDLKFSNSDSTEFMCGKVNGDILLWDIRAQQPILKVETVPGPKSFFKIHDQAPVMACASPNNQITVMTLKGIAIGSIKHNPGYINRIPLILSDLEFHPKQLTLGCASPAFLTIFK